MREDITSQLDPSVTANRINGGDEILDKHILNHPMGAVRKALRGQ